MAVPESTPAEILDSQATPVQVDEKENLRIFLKVWETDPQFTKDFNRGGFKGTQTNPTYNIMRATAVFGPIGIGWGFEEVWHEIVKHDPVIRTVESTDTNGNIIGSRDITYPAEMVYVNYIKVWYLDPITKAMGEVFQFGGTPMLFYDKRGCIFDDEAPKKAMTDGVQKALAAIGFSADIHMGRYDDAKYVADVREKFRQRRGLPACNAQQGGNKPPPNQPNGSTPSGQNGGGQRQQSSAGNKTQGGGNRPAQGNAGSKATPNKAEPSGKPAGNQPSKESQPGGNASAGPTPDTPKPSELKSGTNLAEGETDADRLRREQNKKANDAAMQSVCEATTRARIAELREKIKDPRRPLTADQRAALSRLCDEREKQLPDGA